MSTYMDTDGKNVSKNTYFRNTSRWLDRNVAGFLETMHVKLHFTFKYESLKQDWENRGGEGGGWGFTKLF